MSIKVIQGIKFLFLLFLFSYSLISAAVPTRGLGVSYGVYDFGTYSSNKLWYEGLWNDPNNNNWYKPANNFKHPVYSYHLNPNLVQQQMQNMRASGVDVLVLELKVGDIASCESNPCYDGVLDGVYGNIADASQSAFRSQQKQNLISVLNYAMQVGFRKVFLRFSASMPTGTAWNEVLYQKEWNLIVDTRNTAHELLKNSATRLMVDLGIEQLGLFCAPGVPCALGKQHAQRLWSDYTTVFGTANTVGFSAIACPHIVAEGIKWFGAVKPDEYAFSNYGCDSLSAGDALVASWKALGASEAAKPITIIETHFNRQANVQSWLSALSANPGLRVSELVGWLTTGNGPVNCPPDPNRTCDQNYSQEAVASLSTTNMVSNYLALAGKAAVDNPKPSVLNIDGSNCTSTSAAQFSTCAKINVASAGTNALWQVWVVMNNQSRTLMSCGSGPSVLTANWMAKTYYSYRFDYYKVSSCGASPAIGTQTASSYISFK